MKLNENCKLYLEDLYYYDIQSCHYQILKNLGYDISTIDENDKEKRNIKIGLLQRSNPKITPLLRETTDNLIKDYLLKNQISDDDIISKQYDGFISKKPLMKTDIYDINIPLRYKYNILIISFNRDKFIGYVNNENKTKIKGIKVKNEEVKNIYRKILMINFYNKTSIFDTLNKIKKEILYSKNKKLFLIPNDLDETKASVILKEYGEVEISKSAFKILDFDEIDKEKYYQIYFEPFVKSIVLEFF